MLPNFHRRSPVLIPCLALAGLPITGSGEAEEKAIWFGDIASPENLAPVVRAAYAAVSKGNKVVEGLPDHLEGDRSPRIVFLSIGNTAESARVSMGRGRGWAQSLSDALQHLEKLEDGQQGSKLWLKFDAVKEVHPVEEIVWGRAIQFEASLEGFAIERPQRLALLPEELVAHRLINNENELHHDRVNWYVKSSRNSNGKFQPFSGKVRLKFRRFSCKSFFTDGKDVHALYRGHRLTKEFNPALLIDSARLGGAYLARSVQNNGRFDYLYNPRTAYVSSNYNMVRHAGTIFAMMELYKITKDQKLLDAVERAIHYLTDYIKPFGREKDNASALVFSLDKIKLGGVALAIVGLAEHAQATGSRKHLPIMKRLGNYIILSQDMSGRFVHQRKYSDAKALDFVSQYYPGEAILAMVRLYSLDRQAKWLDAAERGARYLILIRDKGIETKDLTHDHWLLYALNDLYRYRKKNLYLTQSSRIAEAIYSSQNRSGRYQDYPGSYYIPPRSTPTATRSEGLIAAYRLAMDYGSKSEAETIMEAIRRGIAFQLGTQFREEKALYMKNPGKCLGGFSRDLTDLSIRIDYVQHNISALLGLYRILAGDKGARKKQ